VEWTLVQRLVAKRMRICAYDRAAYAWSDHGPRDHAAQVAVETTSLSGTTFLVRLLRAVSVLSEPMQWVNS
jgi:hypothetical protein